jgi:hypothetical protein
MTLGPYILAEAKRFGVTENSQPVLWKNLCSLLRSKAVLASPALSSQTQRVRQYAEDSLMALAYQLRRIT